jgi:orotidine-5'-phosphate decarboxylase
MTPLSQKIILALDVETLKEAEHFVKKLSGSIGIFKVGKQLFTHCGPTIIEMIHRHRGKVFLDLKFHDIPNTVARAVEEACKLNVFMLTIHALGGKKMMQEAVAASSTFARNSSLPSPLILAVTILTSLKPDDLKDIGITTSVEEAVSRLAILARQAGVNGVVASAQEAHIIRAACGNDLIIVTPGIRPQGTSRDDQKRAVTPHEALLAGSDYMVIGRPILEAHDPLKVVQEIAEELREGNN